MFEEEKVVGDLGCCRVKPLTVTSPHRPMKLARKVSVARRTWSKTGRGSPRRGTAGRRGGRREGGCCQREETSRER